MILRFLRLFAQFRILEEEYSRVRAKNRSHVRRIRLLHRERDVLSEVDGQLRGQLDATEARIVELTGMLDEARVSEINATRAVADFQAHIRTGHGIFNRPESEVPIQDIHQMPILKHRNQARDIVKQKTEQYRADLAAMAQKHEEAGAFFDSELKTQ